MEKFQFNKYDIPIGIYKNILKHLVELSKNNILKFSKYELELQTSLIYSAGSTDFRHPIVKEYAFILVLYEMEDLDLLNISVEYLGINESYIVEFKKEFYDLTKNIC